MGIRSLPAYLLQYGEKGILINALMGYDDFASAIEKLTGGRVTPSIPEVSEKAIAALIKRRELVSDIELREAFGIQDMAAFHTMLELLRTKGQIEIYPVKNTRYIRKNKDRYKMDTKNAP